jgi:hypothetical protein
MRESRPYFGKMGDILYFNLTIDRPAPRKPRPEGRGQGELYKNGNLPYRVRKPAKRTPAREGGEASHKRC